MLVKSKINGHCMGYNLYMDEEIDLPEEVVSALGDDVQVIKSKKEEAKEVKGAKNTALTAEDATTKTVETEETKEVKEEKYG